MKRIIAAITLLCALSTGAKAQDVFNEIYRLSEKAANDRTNTLDERKINTFKMDALSYMKTKTLERIIADNKDLSSAINDSTVNKLNHQAYAMYSFVNLFIKRMARCDKQSQLDKVKKTFRETTINNPMYNDPDKALVLSYVNSPGFLTQFSLDTDWEKALEEITNKF